MFQEQGSGADFKHTSFHREAWSFCHKGGTVSYLCDYSSLQPPGTPQRVGQELARKIVAVPDAGVGRAGCFLRPSRYLRRFVGSFLTVVILVGLRAVISASTRVSIRVWIEYNDYISIRIIIIIIIIILLLLFFMVHSSWSASGLFYTPSHLYLNICTHVHGSECSNTNERGCNSTSVKGAVYG